MKKLIFDLWTARVLVIIGVVLALGPIGATFRHIGNENTLLITSSSHSWHHFFREGVGDLAALAIILAVMFAAPRYRNPMAWWLMMVAFVGFYAPFWIGTPFMAELAAPSLSAEIQHLQTAIPAALGCFLARRNFLNSPPAAGSGETTA